MKEKIVCGIQQVGLGVNKLHEAWKWYKKYFGFDVRIFEDKAVAGHMKDYTGGEPCERIAALAMNMQGGGGLEIWQHTGREPKAPPAEATPGDPGIYALKIKSPDVEKTHSWLTTEGVQIIGTINNNGFGEFFFVRDPYGNIIQVVKGDQHWFKLGKKLTGGIYGVIMGVSNMEKSIDFYRAILGYDIIVADQTGQFGDLSPLPGGKHNFRRVLLRRSKPPVGSFSPIFGNSELELIQAIDKPTRRIFEGRAWGDLGFIHICYDIRRMDLLREECKIKGYPFAVDSGEIFSMGDAAGAFAYVEDPDGTLIEFVETFSVPIVKKWGWYFSLKNRKPEKPLPRFMLKAMGLNKASDI